MAVTLTGTIDIKTAESVAAIKSVASATSETATKVQGSARTASAAIDQQTVSTKKAGDAARVSSSSIAMWGSALGGIIGSLAGGAIVGAVSQFTGLTQGTVQAGLAFAALAVQTALTSIEFDVLKVATATWALVSRAAAAASVALGVAMDFMLGPVGLVILAVAAVIAIFVLLYTRVSWFRGAVNAVVGLWVADMRLQINVVIAVFRALVAFFGAVPGWVGSALSAVANIIGAPFRAGAAAVRAIVSGFGGIFSGVAGAVAGALSGVFGAIIAPFESAFSWIESNVIAPIRGAWNGIANVINGFSITLPSIKIPLGPTIGGQTISFPNMPTLAQGGVVDRATLAVIGEGSGREIVTPENLLRDIVSEGPSASAATVNLNVTVNVPPTANAAEVGRHTTRMLQAYVRANGSGSLGRALGLVPA